MNNDEKIVKALEALQADVKDMKQGQARLEKGQKNMATKDDIEPLEHGQMRLESQMLDLQRGQYAIREIVQLMNQTLVKQGQSHEKRIENLEEHTGTHDPTKN